MRTFIAGIPKAELHLHIEGTLEPDLKFRLAERNVLLEEHDFFDLAFAYFTKAASQNVVYAEVFFDPQAHTSRGVAFGTVIRGIRRAQDAADAELGLRTRLIMCFLRDHTAESAAQTLAAAEPYREWITGVGLDSDEMDNPPLKFADVFAAARRQGYRLTMHCDVDQHDSTVHIRQCLDDIGVDRIDHGVNCLDDPSLVDEIKRRGLGLTVCPISNSYVTDGLKAGEVRQMLDEGLRVSINSDDPAYFPGYMTENLIAVQEGAALDRDQIVQLVRNAFETAWVTEDERAGFLRQLEQYTSTAS